ncbi:MAG: hypothetical protein Q9M32_06470 [Sulfurimonas sp.]|nr:hypothetical protein [Sulfurimonas sp.]MDQ7062372.1 hypothetical protein [Sulfurimonas sp.]
MLDSTVWRQYNEENNFREELAKYTQIEAINLIEDEKELYGILKAKLTKKELKLFAMDSAALSDEKIGEAFSYTVEELEKAKFKLYKKFKQDKTRLSFRIAN